MNHLFEGKSIVVTGGGQGIGLCIAQEFLKCGASVVIAEHKAELEPKALAFLNAGRRVLFVQTDVADEASIRHMAERTVERFGRIDCVIHNAAISIAPAESVDQLDYAYWQRVLNVNLSGAFLCAKHCKAELVKNRGAMVNIASTRALMSEANTEAYSATKGGLVALTHALAISLGPEVHVNCISPGWIVTDAYQYGQHETKLTEADHAQHPVGRVGRPEDIAAMALYLCSDKAGFITGQNFIVDGGMTKKMIYV
jgi:NAD(P)-dependent dehydrogenase (short-subunit alcohol dehydrogenase family)